MPSFRTVVELSRPGVLQPGPTISNVAASSAATFAWTVIVNRGQLDQRAETVIGENSRQIHENFVEGIRANAPVWLLLPLQYAFDGIDVDVTAQFLLAFTAPSGNRLEGSMTLEIADGLGDGKPYRISGTYFTDRRMLTDQSVQIRLNPISLHDNWVDGSANRYLPGMTLKVSLELPPHMEEAPVPFVIEEDPVDFTIFADRISDDIDFTATTLDIETDPLTTTELLPTRFVTLRTYDDPRFDLQALTATLAGESYRIDSVSDDNPALGIVRLQLRRFELE